MNTTTLATPPTTTAPGRPNDDTVSAHLRALAEEAEALLKATARAGDDKVHSARARLSDELTHIRTRLAELEHGAAESMKNAAHRTDVAVHAHPYAAMGASAAIGLLLGFVLGRR